MATLQDQLDWEKEATDRGTARYIHEQSLLKGKSASERVDAYKFVMHKGLIEAAEGLKARCSRTKGVGMVINKTIRSVVVDDDYVTLVYIGVRHMLSETQRRKPLVITPLAKRIGRSIELELMAQKFQAVEDKYYTAMMKNLQKERKISSNKHLQVALRKKFAEFNIGWQEWEEATVLSIGSAVIEAIINEYCDVFYMVKPPRKPALIAFTEEFDRWVGDFENARGALMPYRLPLKIPPIDWTPDYQGGYYTQKLKRATPMIKFRNGNHRRFVEEQPAPKIHSEAMNNMQRTSWKVNKKVLDCMQHVFTNNLGAGLPRSAPVPKPYFPDDLRVKKEELTDAQLVRLKEWKQNCFVLYKLELQRRAKVINFSQAFTLAKELQDWPEFYFAYHCDFRGRFYCATTGLSPQGNDPAKSLLMSAVGKPLGTRDAANWLAIHGANCFGLDKAPYQERIDWAHQNSQMIYAIVDDPISNREYWSEADKPWQFLAWCFDWAKTDYGHDLTAESHTMVAMDGSCNGLQHFSAMFHDEVGAFATNLIDSDTPQDIYQQVADLVNSVQSKYVVTRAAVKRQVMTLPYGSTKRSCSEYTWEWLAAEYPDAKWADALELSHHIWDCIGRVVIKAREAMDWLKSVDKQFVKYRTPVSDFPVYQDYPKVTGTTRVATQLQGKLSLRVGVLDKNTPDMSKQRSGISPNLIHSLDSTHLALVVNELGSIPMAMIHDDFGVLAADANVLAAAIREAFVYMYQQDIIGQWAKQLGMDVKVGNGEFDIDNIMDAKYFFG